MTSCTEACDCIATCTINARTLHIYMSFIYPFIRHPYPSNNASGKMRLHSQEPSSLLPVLQTGFLFPARSDRKRNQKSRGQSMSGIWLPQDKQLLVSVRGTGTSAIGLASEKAGCRYSTGQVFPVSLTSFKLWIHLVIYQRNSMDTNCFENSWQKSFKRTNEYAHILGWDLDNFILYWALRYSSSCLDNTSS